VSARFSSEKFSARARVEAVVEAEVDRVGAGGERGAQAGQVAGGGQDLRSAAHRHDP
jgi:hypothetical protein